MATIAEQLTSLANTKTAIKDAIVAKGVSVSDTDTFRSYADKIGQIESGGDAPATKYGVTVDLFLGDLTTDGQYLPKSSTDFFEIDFTGFDSMYVGGFSLPDGTMVTTQYMKYAFYGRGLLGGTVDLSWLKNQKLLAAAPFENAFSHTGIEEIILPDVPEVQLALDYVANNCPRLKRIVLNATVYEQVTPGVTLNGSFQFCNGIQEIVGLENITKIGKYGFNNTFSTCRNLPEEWNFDSLQEVSGSYAMGNTWQGCTGAKRFYFPALTIITADSFSNPGWGAPWYNNKEVEEIHFRADMQATVEATSGYSGKWGATNADIIFDL